MATNKDKKPIPGGLLYKNLFTVDEEVTFKRISEGLKTFPDSAANLLEEARLLINANKTSRADFLITTAQEEIVKSYILLDACRIDFKKHESVLKKICAAFYSHIAKHAYYEIIRHNSSNLFKEMTKVKDCFTIAMKEWWPASGGAEDTEPDMPNDVFFKRDINLYSDFSDYDQMWITPHPDGQRFKFEHDIIGNNPLEECEKLLKRIVDTRNAGLYEPSILKIMNGAFKKYYVRETTQSDEIINIYVDVSKKIESNYKILGSVFYSSALYEWPVYHFLVDNEYRSMW